MRVVHLVRELVRRVRSGEQPTVRVPAAFAEVLVGELVGAGFRLADVGLEHIRDDVLRERIRTVLVAGATGAVIGGAVGALAGPSGVPVGAAIGAGVGVAAGAVALALR